MQIFELLTRRPQATPTPMQKPGRHSTVGLVDRLTRELAELKEARDKEVRGYQDALQQAGRDVMEARSRSDFNLRGWKAADAEVKRLQAILDADAGTPGTMPQPAVADTEGSCFNEPAPPTPDRDQEQLPPIALTLPRPVECEAADVNAETQAVAQVDLDDTQLLPKVVVEEAIGLGDTQTLPPVTPVVPVLDKPLPPVTWGRNRDPETAAIEANLNTPAPTPEYAASAVPPGIPDLALSEAS